MNSIARTLAAGAVLVSALAASPARAVTINTEALVTIVEGIEVFERNSMNFGTLALNDGNVTVASDGTVVSDANHLVFDDSNLRNATFEVDSVLNATLQIAIAGSSNNGLILDQFVVDFGTGETSVPMTHTLTSKPATMLVGANLRIDTLDAAQGPDQVIPYSVSVTFE